jgi:hypothetical protein
VPVCLDKVSGASVSSIWAEDRQGVLQPAGVSPLSARQKRSNTIAAVMRTAPNQSMRLSRVGCSSWPELRGTAMMAITSGINDTPAKRKNE